MVEFAGPAVWISSFGAHADGGPYYLGHGEWFGLDDAPTTAAEFVDHLVSTGKVRETDRERWEAYHEELHAFDVDDPSGFLNREMGPLDIDKARETWEALDREGLDVAAWLAWCDNHHADRFDAGSIGEAREAFAGEWGSVAEWIEELYGDIGPEIPDTFAGYIDWERMGRDAVLGGDIWTHEPSHGNVMIFWNH